MLRVTDWDKHFENNRTRELQRLDWLPVPNKMDGDGYTELVTHPDGAAHFGGWVALIEIASRCKPRGTLVRASGIAHDAASLARLSRLPERVFVAAIPRLLTMGWLEDASGHGAAPQGAAIIPQAGAEERLRNGTEGNGMEDLPAAQASAESARGDSTATPDDLVVLTYPCDGNPPTWNLLRSGLQRLAEHFPALAIEAECRAALAWVEANDRKRKTASGMKRFITNWMTTATNDPRRRARPDGTAEQTAGPATRPGVADRKRAMLEAR